MECQSRHHALLAKKWGGGYSPPSPPGSGVPEVHVLTGSGMGERGEKGWKWARLNDERKASNDRMRGVDG